MLIAAMLIWTAYALLWLAWRILRGAWYRPALGTVAAVGLLITLEAGLVIGASAALALGASTATWRAVRIGRVLGGSKGLWPTLTALSSAGVRGVRLRRDWPSAADAVQLVGKDSGQPIRLGRLSLIGPTRASAVIRLAGTAAPVWDKLAGDPMALLARELGVRSATIEPIRGKSALARLTFYWASRLDGAVPLGELPPPRAGWAMFGLGEDDHGIGLRLDVSTLFVGESRSGKSTTMWALIASTLEQQTLPGGHAVQWWVIDQSETEFASLQPLAAGRYVKGQNQAKGMLDALQAECRRRAKTLEAAGKRKWAPGDPDMPRIILVIDEMLQLINKRLNPKMGQACEGLLMYVLTQAAKYGVVAWAGTQAGQVATVSYLRDFFQQRVALSTASRAMTDCSLGEGAHAGGADCHNLVVPRDAGTGWARHDDRSGYRKFRSCMVENDEAELLGTGQLPDSVRRARGNRSRLAEYPGWVYVLWSEPDSRGQRECLYVGKTREAVARNRWRDHLWGSDMQEWADEVDWVDEIPCADAEDAGRREVEMIHRLNPRYNIIRYDVVRADR